MKPLAMDSDIKIVASHVKSQGIILSAPETLWATSERKRPWLIAVGAGFRCCASTRRKPCSWCFWRSVPVIKTGKYRCVSARKPLKIGTFSKNTIRSLGPKKRKPLGLLKSRRFSLPCDTRLIFREILVNQECSQMAKITMKSSASVAETFEDFLINRKARGLADKTLKTYKQHFSAIARLLRQISQETVIVSRSPFLFGGG